MGQPPQNNKNNISEGLIQEWIKTEQLKVSLKTEEIKLRAQEIASNERLAKEGMNYQFQLEQKEPRQHKETVLVYTVCVVLLVVVFLGFLGYLVVNGQAGFADKFLNWISYLVVSLLSFFAGRFTKGSKKKEGEEGVSDAQIIN